MPQYHTSSNSSGSVERYHTSNPRREGRDRKDPRPTPKREVVVIHHNTTTRDDPVRTSGMSHNRWK
ncbi:uncharacterized protein A1O9_00145 [Exophiala aquamarina CBS 119918]|uniref:Uncharacterized protein n=1 Tax=Exophiala aquamarina CBS 119918 TaxID=1182545 RepID=A0A072PS63_9EURO|nr:uncharacterized protein A1O9_00145 [Exophiala aquamarina CBS 119918]KEF62173.1 hypothetical protein A1O9_00145 [Exophiala aquamarina CBS 119918]